jgi:hypothetical protein
MKHAPIPANHAKVFGLAMFIALIAGVGFFLLSFVELGVRPCERLNKAMRTDAPVGTLNYTIEEPSGRALYASNGCAYCRTLQVRFLEADVDRWGRARRNQPIQWTERGVRPLDCARTEPKARAAPCRPTKNSTDLTVVAPLGDQSLATVIAAHGVGTKYRCTVARRSFPSVRESPIWSMLSSRLIVARRMGGLWVTPSTRWASMFK